MRLYLSSFRLGKHTDELVRLVGTNKYVAIIQNAYDYREPQRYLERLNEQKKTLSVLGLIPEELDLRKYFGKQKELEDILKKFGLVWVMGGNCFILQRAFEQSGFDIIIKKMIAENEIVYGGFSAGVCIVTPSLKGTELVDDPNIIPKGYKKDFSWNGLGFLNYAVAVHFKSDHPESEMVDKEVDYLKKNNIPYKTLRDGEVIVVDGEKEEILK